MKSPILLAAYTNYRRDPRVKREAESLVEAGYDVVFLASRQPDEPNREVVKGVRVIKVPRFNKRRTSQVAYIADYLFFFLALLVHVSVRPRRYRLIHVNNMPDFLVFATVLPRVLGVPIVHDVHDLMPELFAEKFGVGDSSWLVRMLLFQERWACRMANSVLTVEGRLKEQLCERGVPEQKIRVLMNLPDERIFSPRAESLVKGPDEPFVVVYHGTLARRLGLDIAVRAVEDIGDKIPSLELRIIGAGEERQKLIELRDELGMQKRVTFSDGYVPVEAIPGLLSDADVGIVPLRLSGGTDIMLPTKLLEYVFVGIPCVVPLTATIGRYFDETMVKYFKAESHTSLAQALLELYRKPSLREEIVSNATERFARDHRWSEHRKVYLDLVEELGGPPSRSTDDERPIPK